MNNKIWACTNSNYQGFHAFEDGKAMCNSRIKPCDGWTHLTAEEVKTIPQTYLCERCEKKVAKESRTNEIREAVKTLPASEVHTIADEQGRVIFIGNANTHKRADLRWAQAMTVSTQGRYVVLTAEGGRVQRFSKATNLYVMAVPAGYGEAAQEPEATQERHAQAIEAETVREEKAEAHARRTAYGKRKARTERVVTDQAEKVAIIESATYATPEDAAAAERQKSSPAPLHLIEIDPEAEREESPEKRLARSAGLLPAEAPQVEREESPFEREDRQEREAFEAAKVRAERLRDREAHTVTVPVVKAPANFRELAREGNTTAAKRYWQRRCEEFEMVETVKAHARANYDLGWDTVVECYTDAEILEYLREEYVNATTPQDAVKAFDSLADDWAANQCDSLVAGYGV